MTGSMSGMIQMDFSHIDLSKAAQMSQMRASAQQVENTVQRLSTTAAGIFEDFMTEHRTRVVKNGGVFREGGVIRCTSRRSSAMTRKRCTTTCC